MLARAFGYSYDQVMLMPTARRHKMVKWYEEVITSGSGGSSEPTTTTISSGDKMPQTWYQRVMGGGA